MCLSGFESRDGCAVVVENTVASVCSNPWTRNDHADQVQRICRTHRDQTVLWTSTSDRTQHSDRVRQGKLFSGNTTNETAATHIAARFKSMIGAKQEAPWQRHSLTLQQPLEHHTVTSQQRPRHVFS